MDLSIKEIAILRALADPRGVSGFSRTQILHAASNILGEPESDERVTGVVLDQLVAKKYVERVQIGFFRNTPEGYEAFKRGVRELNEITSRLYFN